MTTKETEKDIDINKNILAIANNNNMKNIDDKINIINTLKENTKVRDTEEDFFESSLNFKNYINIINSSTEENNQNNILKNIDEQFGKLTKIKEIHFDKTSISLSNKNKRETNNILNKNKKMILYPILMKKSKSNINISNFPKKKIKSIKKNLSQNKLKDNKDNKDKKKNNKRKSIFSLILNGVPDFNNQYLTKNIKLKKVNKQYDYFKNAKLIDKNILKLPKEKSFFYKGCESLLTMNNNENSNNIPIIDLLKYDKLYEKKFFLKKRNNSAVNKPNISLSKLN